MLGTRRCFQVAMIIAVSSIVAAAPPRSKPASRTGVAQGGTLAAAAIRESLGVGGSKRAFDEMMAKRASIAQMGSDTEWHTLSDPYAPWLAAHLLLQATRGELFRMRDGKIRIRFDAESQDRLYWYIARAELPSENPPMSRLRGPWLLWQDPTQAWCEFEIDDLANNDIALIEIYRVPRSTELEAPQQLINRSFARQVVRVPVPVQVK